MQLDKEQVKEKKIGSEAKPEGKVDAQKQDKSSLKAQDAKIDPQASESQKPPEAPRSDSKAKEKKPSMLNRWKQKS